MFQPVEAFFIASLGMTVVLLVFLLWNNRNYIQKAVFSLFLVNVILLIVGFLAIQAGAIAGIPYFTEMFMTVTLCASPLHRVISCPRPCAVRLFGFPQNRKQ